jgi:serine/threonine protein kinase
MSDQTSLKVTDGTSLGRYTILELVGSGAMGVVYQARDERLERIVAIKVLTPGVLTGDESRRRFRKEALALAKLNHAHIAAVYDVGEQDGIDYLVMELVQGESLAAKIKAAPVPVKEATSILLRVAGRRVQNHARYVHSRLGPCLRWLGGLRCLLSPHYRCSHGHQSGYKEHPAQPPHAGRTTALLHLLATSLGFTANCNPFHL